MLPVPDKKSNKEQIETYALENNIDISAGTNNFAQVGIIRKWAKENGVSLDDAKKPACSISYFDLDRSRTLIEFSVEAETREEALELVEKKKRQLVKAFSITKNGEDDITVTTHRANANTLVCSLFFSTKYIEPIVKRVIEND